METTAQQKQLKTNPPKKNEMKPNPLEVGEREGPGGGETNILELAACLTSDVKHLQAERRDVTVSQRQQDPERSV